MIIIEGKNKLSILSVLERPRNSIIYKVTDGTNSFVMKASLTPSDTDREAFEDEYLSISRITHQALPKYYAYYTCIRIPDAMEPVPAVLMEYVDGVPLSLIEHLTTKQLKKYILDLGDTLLVLFQQGILYLDLHPGNLIIQNNQIRLVDFTKAYYYQRNPNPSYMPKTSYQLNQHLPGQQLLIQALTLLLLHLPEQSFMQGIPPSLIRLGEHPHQGITFSEFLNKIDREWVT